MNIDPIAILSYKDNDSVLDWISYSLYFINNIRYRSIDEAFDLVINKTDGIAGDALDLYGGYNHTWNKGNVPLTFSTSLNIPYFGFDIYGEDITFGRFSSGERGSNIAGANLSFKFTPLFPLEISLGGLISLENNDLSINGYYPEVSLYIPFYNKGFDKAGLTFGSVFKIAPDGNLNFKKNGYMIGMNIPIQFGDFNAKGSVTYSSAASDKNGYLNLHYLKFNNIGYKPISVGNSSLITAALEASYNHDIISVDMKVAADIMLSTMKFVKENSLLYLAISSNFYNVGLSAGLSVQNFTEKSSYVDNANIFAGLSFSLGDITSTLKGGISSLSQKDFYLSYEGSVSFLNQERKEARKNIENSFPVYFDLHTGYIYTFNEKASTFVLEPVLTIGKDNTAISLRAPLLFTTKENGDLAIAGINGSKWWDFGYSETGYKKIYRVISDSISLINYLTLGNQDKSIAYLNIERDRLMNGTIFSSFGSEKTSSLSTGFNFPNLGINIYADNLEAPHIGKASFSVYPMGVEGIALNLTIPTEFYIKDSKNFSIFFYPEFGVDVPLFTKHLRLSAFASSVISVGSKDGIAENLKIIYDFNNKQFFAAMAGMDLYTDFDFINMHLIGGIRKGTLSPDMYNVFTSLYNEKPSIDNTDNGFSFFAKVAAKLELDAIDLSLTYSVKDIERLIKENINYNEDLLSAAMRVKITDAMKLTGEFHRRGLISLFSGKHTLADVFYSTDTIYSLGLEIDLGKVSIAGKYSTLPIQSAFSVDSEYLNINNGYDKSAGITTAFALTTRISF